MRHVEFKILPPVGSGTMPASGSVADLLRHLPTLLAWGLVPPLAVVNAKLAKGVDDAGMGGGCTWAPFTVDSAEYAEIAEDLIARGDGDGAPLEDGGAPAWVESDMDWFVWVCFRRQGIPVDEHRALQRELTELELARADATRVGDDDRLVEIISREGELTEAINSLIVKHRKS